MKYRIIRYSDGWRSATMPERLTGAKSRSDKRQVFPTQDIIGAPTPKSGLSVLGVG